MNRNEDASMNDADVQQRLYMHATEYQFALREYRNTDEPEQQVVLLAIQQEMLEQLYLDLREPLIRLVRRWAHSLIGQEQRANKDYTDALESLAISSFGDIAFALQTCQLDPERNVRSYLLQIAKNNLYDQLYDIYDPRTSQSNKTEPIRTEMWPLPYAHIEGVWMQGGEGDDESYLAEPEDPDSVDFDVQLINNRDNQMYLQAIISFWKKQLTAIDLLIVQLRWMQDPPLAFEAIARRIGDGWTAAAVRQRHHRIIERTRYHLADLGLGYLHDEQA